MMLAMSEVLQIHMRPLLVSLRTHRPRGTLALEDLMTEQGTSMQANALPERCDVLATLQKLPPVCLTRSKVSRAVIAIRRGELGYYLVEAQLSPEEFNQRHGITQEQVAAMENGAVHGWEVPEADPDIVRVLGLAHLSGPPAEGRYREQEEPQRRAAVP